VTTTLRCCGRTREVPAADVTIVGSEVTARCPACGQARTWVRSALARLAWLEAGARAVA
jgi:hypothetical protein